MADLRSPRLIYLKGFLFLVGGIMSAGLLILEHPTFKVALLLGLAVWCFARFYYFAFYVIQHYVDPAYRFAGLGSFARYLLRRRAGTAEKTTANKPPNEARPDAPAPPARH